MFHAPKIPPSEAVMAVILRARDQIEAELVFRAETVALFERLHRPRDAERERAEIDRLLDELSAQR